MKTTPFKFDDLHNVQLSQDAAPSDGRPIQAPAGFGIRRAHAVHVRSGSRMKVAFSFALVLLLWPALVLQAATTVTNIAAGEDYSLFIKSDGSLWGVGDNGDGELGDGTNVLVDVPVEIVSNNVVAVAAGGDFSSFWGTVYSDGHSLFIKTDGSLWGMGNNYYGELGDGTTNDVNTPEEIVSNNVVAVAAGADHSLFIKSDGSLWGMGYNGDGELGNGTNVVVNVPVEIVSNNVVAVAAGGDHSLFVKSDGSLWGMGGNSFGQLGDGTTNDVNAPEEIVSNNVVAVAAGGGDLRSDYMGEIIGVAAHSLFIKSDGSLWGMGINDYGQLGNGTFELTNQPVEIVSNNVVAVAVGLDCSLFLKSNGSLWGMGAPEGLGDGFDDNSLFPEQILPTPRPMLSAPALAAKVVPPTVTNIAAGDRYSFLIKSDGSLWVLGANYSGQLGDGSFDKAYPPEQIVSSNVVAVATGAYYYTGGLGDAGYLGLHSLFLKSDGSLWGMGDNTFGKLGDGTSYSTNKPEEIVTNGVVAVAAGGGASLFIKSDGSLWAMGDNYSGQLGDGTFNNAYWPEEITSNDVVAVTAGGSGFEGAGGFQWWASDTGHSLFVKSDGSLWGMGYNGDGELGDSTFNFTNTPEEIVFSNVVEVVAGDSYSLFIKSDGSLWGMGNTSDAQLGDGTNVDGNMPHEMVSCGVVAVATRGDGFYGGGVAHTLFIKSDGSLWGMGFNGDGELGDGTTNDVLTPEEIVSKGVVAVAAGLNHSLFLKSDGSLWGMGDNSDGELGNGSSSSLVPEKLAGGPWLRGTCFAGGTYRLLSSTNAAMPLSQWTPVWTNTVVHRGPNNFSAPLPDDVLLRDPQRFYLLQAQ